jgi:beta-barrel assembly-enhancing protease
MNKKKLLWEGIVLLLIFGSIWGIFTMFPIGPRKAIFRLSVEKEEKLGELLLKATLSNPEFRRIENDTVLKALDIITKRLCSALDSNRYSYQTVLVENGIANAFALPGGYIVVTTGLIGLMKSPEECAAVLAHEIGHIEQRHTLSKLLANFTASILFSDEALASEAAELLTTSAFSRRQEEEADRFGLRLLEKSRINPHIMGTAFRHLKEESGAYNPQMEIVMSHPDLDSRIKSAYQYTLEKNFSEEKIDINWDAVKDQIIHPISQ